MKKCFVMFFLIFLSSFCFSQNQSSSQVYVLAPDGTLQKIESVTIERIVDTNVAHPGLSSVEAYRLANRQADSIIRRGPSSLTKTDLFTFFTKAPLATDTVYKWVGSQMEKTVRIEKTVPHGFGVHCIAVMCLGMIFFIFGLGANLYARTQKNLALYWMFFLLILGTLLFALFSLFGCLWGLSVTQTILPMTPYFIFSLIGSFYAIREGRKRGIEYVEENKKSNSSTMGMEGILL